MKWTRVLAATLLSAFWSLPLLAQTVEPELQLERLSFGLTGLPSYLTISADLRERYLNQEATLEELAEKLRQNPRFVERLAEYWLQVLKITEPLNWEGSRDLAKTTTTNTLLEIIENGFTVAGRRLLITDECKAFNAADGGAVFLQVFPPAVDPDPNNKFSYDDREIMIKNCAVHCATSTDDAKYLKTGIRPYWDPSKNLKGCIDLEREMYCGPGLKYCLPNAINSLTTVLDKRYSFFDYRTGINYGLTLEPGIMIGRIIQEGRSWNEVVTTTKGIVNGPYADFINRFYHIMGGVFPAGSYPHRKYGMGQGTTIPAGVTTEAGFAAPNPLAADSWQWVERGPKHAGILTSMAFHRATNGWRAKANRSFQALLCREFKVDPDTPQPPSSETDLTKRPYCQNCHLILEPLSRFFGRWPNVGNDNSYFYNAAAAAHGAFNGEAAEDTAGLAAILTGMRDFDECAIRRGFEFLVNRPLSDVEEKTMLPLLYQKFIASGKSLWPVMVEIIKSKAFIGE